MERWCREMGFKTDDMDGFIKEFKKCCHPTEKPIWSHIIAHVRPKKEVEMIRKQCLLSKLRTSKDRSSIEIYPKSLEEHSKYLEKKKEQNNLKKLLDSIEKKKASIAERTNKLEQTGLRIEDEEEILKQNIYKLGQLKKKNITVTRRIGQLVDDTKLLQLITNDPNDVVGFGPDTTVLGRQVLMTVKELPEGAKLQTIISKMSDLLKASDLPPVRCWDRTEILTQMENKLISMVEKLDSCRKSLKQEENDIKNLKPDVINFIMENTDGSFIDDDAEKILQSVEEQFIEDARTVSEELKSAKPPQTLALENLQIKRLQRQIDGKVQNIIKLFPIEDKDIEYDSELERKYAVDHLPPKLPVDKLFNSIAEEVDLFSKIRLYEPVQTEKMFSQIRLGSSSASQLAKLKKDCEILSGLISLEEKMYSLDVPSADLATEVSFKERTDTLSQEMKDAKQTLDGLLVKVTENFEKLKEAFLFLKKEPLNEELTGLEIEGEDINHWLNRFKRANQRLVYEEWFKTKVSEDTNQSSSNQLTGSD